MPCLVFFCCENCFLPALIGIRLFHICTYSNYSWLVVIEILQPISLFDIVNFVSTRQVINCIWKHPGAPVVYLTCDMLGQEEILVNVSQTFGSKIFIDKEGNPDCYQALKLTVPEILSEDSSSRFHVFDGFPKLSERAEAKLAEARNNSQPEPLIIRPSAQWYAFDEGSSETEIRRKERFNEAVRDQFGIWHVCYSMHSSREELEWALRLLAPKWVVSTTPSCRAMELTYVKKHCFIAQVASDDPLWKLLDISVEAPQTEEHISAESPSCSSVLKTYAEPQSKPISIPTTNQRTLLNLSPPSKRPVTLFGRARLGLSDSDVFHEQNERISINDDPPHSVSTKIEQDNLDIVGRARFGLQDSALKEKEFVNSDPLHSVYRKGDSYSSFEKVDIVEEACDKSPENKKTDEDIIEPEYKSAKIMTQAGKASSSPIGSSKRFSVNLRNLYRSMNVPVPQPLPSLVELMNSIKNAKRKYEF